MSTCSAPAATGHANSGQNSHLSLCGAAVFTGESERLRQRRADARFRLPVSLVSLTRSTAAAILPQMWKTGLVASVVAVMAGCASPVGVADAGTQLEFLT